MKTLEYPSAIVRCAHGRIPDQFANYMEVGQASSLCIKLPPLEDAERQVTTEDTEVVFHHLSRDEGLLSLTLQGNLTFNVISMLFKGREGGRANDKAVLTKDALEALRDRGFFNTQEQVKLKLEIAPNEFLFLKKVTFMPKIKASVSENGEVTTISVIAEIYPAVFPSWSPELGFFGQHIKGEVQ